MKLTPTLAASLLLALPLSAQLTPLVDPANLAGERVSAPSLADILPIDHGALALQQLLRKLGTRASFMLIVAHPDDEDGGLLTYLSRGQGARVAMLTLNRGEGGQNLMSADFDDALGLIRTQELLAADRTMGVDQLFGTEVDFGFSKTKEEAFSKWTHDRVLYDAVRAVRLYRPLVIASVFIGGPSDGHGQHQVAGEIAQEVFNAAGDPKVFPDQIAAGLQPWQPLKVYARVPFARIVTDATGGQTIYDYATNQYTPARFTNYVTGKVTTTIPRASVIIPEGTPDPLLGGLSYFQFARQGLALQKTQIGGNVRLAAPGPHDVACHRYGSHLPGQSDGDDDPALESSLFAGIDTSLQGIATVAPDAPRLVTDGLQAIARSIAGAQAVFDPAHVEQTAPALRTALDSLDDLIRNVEPMSMLPPQQRFSLLHELRIKRVQLNDALVLADGITLNATIADPAAGQELSTGNSETAVDISISNAGKDGLQIKHASLALPGAALDVLHSRPLPAHQSTATQYSLVLNRGLPPTRPYFSRLNVEQPYYELSNKSLRNAPETPVPLIVQTEIEDNGVQLELASIVAYQQQASIGGRPITVVPPLASDQPVVIVPPVSVSFWRSAGIIPLDDKQPMIYVNSRIREGKCTSYTVDGPSCSYPVEQASIQLSSSQGWTMKDEVTGGQGGAAFTQFDRFRVIPPPDAHSGDTLTATAVSTWNGNGYRDGFRTVGYAGLPSTNYYTPATYRATAVDLQLPEHLELGYVSGTGDDVFPSLFQVPNLHIENISAESSSPESLRHYDAIILGVRAYEANPRLAAANATLNAYAAAGGIVIAQYNTGHLPEGTGPYPLSLGKPENVVEEDAPVQILAPQNPLLTWPNRITTADFDGWVEERGHGFMSTWDPHYQALLETHDHGQAPQRGGLLVAHTGHGAWIYLGLALYRQLPEGVPGSYRLLANLISAAKNPAFLTTSPPEP